MKTTLLFLSLAAIATAQVKVSDLPAASTLTGAELTVTVQSGTTKKGTVQQIGAYTLSASGTLTGKTISGADNTLSNVPFSALVNLPTTLAGHGITDGLTAATAAATYALAAHNQAWSTITSTPTTLAGYGIADGITAATAASTYALASHTQAWSTITSKPSTLAGYGISDGITAAAAANTYATIAAIAAKADTEVLASAEAAAAEFNFSGESSDNLAGEYVTLSDTSGTVAVWFNVEGANTAPGVADRELEVTLATAMSDADTAAAFANLIEADAAFTASQSGAQITVTASSTGPRNWNNGNTGLTFNIISAGSDEVRAISIINGSLLTDLNAAELTGNLLVEQFNGGSNASAGTFWRGDGQWAAASFTGGTLTSALIQSTNGASSAAPMRLTGTIYTGGSSTTTKPQLLIEPSGTTSTGWSTSGTGLGINTGSGFNGNLIDTQVNGTSVFKITSAGRVIANDGSAAAPSLTFSASASNTIGFYGTSSGVIFGAYGSPQFAFATPFNGSAFALHSNAAIEFSATSSPLGAPDLFIKRPGVGILGLTGSSTGAALEITEMSAPAAPATNQARLYIEDNGSGKTRLMVKFATGAAQQIAIEP